MKKPTWLTQGCSGEGGEPRGPGGAETKRSLTVISWYSDLPYIRLYSARISRRSSSLRDTMMRIRVRSFVPAPYRVMESVCGASLRLQPSLTFYTQPTVDPLDPGGFKTKLRN